MAGKAAFTGSWRITDMEMWDADARDLLGPAYIEFGRDGDGEFRFIAVTGWMDCRYGIRDGKALVEFSWQGKDERDETMGRGWAVLEDPDLISGRIYIHMGDDSAFTAIRGGKALSAEARGRRVTRK